MKVKEINQAKGLVTFSDFLINEIVLVLVILNIVFYVNFFHKYKMLKDSSARYYQKKQKQKKTQHKRGGLVKSIKIFLKKKNSDSMVANDIKISLNMKT